MQCRRVTAETQAMRAVHLADDVCGLVAIANAAWHVGRVPGITVIADRIKKSESMPNANFCVFRTEADEKGRMTFESHNPAPTIAQERGNESGKCVACDVMARLRRFPTRAGVDGTEHRGGVHAQRYERPGCPSLTTFL